MSYAKPVKPGSKVRLKDVDPRDHDGVEEMVARAMTAELGKELSDLQGLMFAAGMHSLLVVLQGRDTSGKDGTVRCLSHYLNVLNCNVVPFKQPTELELSHDFLWRVHPHAPAKGHVAIFNRSHYEDVLVVRVHKIVPEKVWKKRYGQICEFEELLVSNNTIIAKFYLHISKAEQEQRLLEREQDPHKAWKLSVGDWKERALWGEYSDAYDDVLDHCSNKNAPWYIVPADHKWFRDLAVVQALVDALKPYKKDWESFLKQEGKAADAELKAYRESKKKP